MEKIVFEKDLKVLCVVANSFPDGALAAFQTLHSTLQNKENRQHFGISHGNADGSIRYMAAATALYDHEAEELGLDTFTIQSGPYLGETVSNYMKDFPAIGHTFERLLKDPNLDPQGYCLEIYTPNGQDVQCLVKLNADD